ncbi:MAG: hypothetical protein ACXW6R_27400, partial [Candidatus Binatia bacterium]
NQLPSLKTLAADSDTSAIGFGIYAADQIKLGQYFDLIGGVRWDYFDAEIKDHFLDDKRKQIDKCGVIEAVWSFTRLFPKVIIFPTAHRSTLPLKALPSPSHQQHATGKKRDLRSRRQARFFWRRPWSPGSGISYRQNQCTYAESD